MLDTAREVGSSFSSYFWGGVNKATSTISNYLPSKETKETISNAASVVGKTGYYVLVGYGRYAADYFVIGEAINFFNPKKEHEAKTEAGWMDYASMGLAVISSGYLMLTVYNISRKKGQAHQQILDTPKDPLPHNSHSKLGKAVKFGAMFFPLALVAYGGSFFFIQQMLTNNQIVLQLVSIPTGIAVGYDSSILHESHGDEAKEDVWTLYRNLKTRIAKAKFWPQAAGLLLGHGVEAYLQCEGGLRALTASTNAEWAHYFRPAASMIFAIPVIHIATRTEMHSILTSEDSNQSIYFLVAMLGWIGSIVHTLGPAMGAIEFPSAGKCGVDTSFAEITPECDSSLAHSMDLLPKIGLFAGSVLVVGLIGGKGFRAATIPDVNEVAKDAWNAVKEKTSHLRISFWHRSRGEEVALTSGNQNNGGYGTNDQPKVADQIVIGISNSN